MGRTPRQNPSYLARALLNTEVTWPFGDPDDPDNIPTERTVSLEGVLFSELPKTLFDNPEEDARCYGRAGLDREFERLGKELWRLKTTAAVDKGVLLRGEEILRTLITGMRREEEHERQQVDPAVWAKVDQVFDTIKPGCLKTTPMRTSFQRWPTIGCSTMAVPVRCWRPCWTICLRSIKAWPKSLPPRPLWASHPFAHFDRFAVTALTHAIASGNFLKKNHKAPEKPTVMVRSKGVEQTTGG